MNRLDELKKYYYQCEKIKILEINKQLVADVNLSFEKRTDNSEQAVTFSIEPTGTQLIGDSLMTLLKNWLDYAIKIWHDEVTLTPLTKSI